MCVLCRWYKRKYVCMEIIHAFNVFVHDRSRAHTCTARAQSHTDTEKHTDTKTTNTHAHTNAHTTRCVINVVSFYRLEAYRFVPAGMCVCVRARMCVCVCVCVGVCTCACEVSGQVTSKCEQARIASELTRMHRLLRVLSYNYSSKWATCMLAFCVC